MPDNQTMTEICQEPIEYAEIQDDGSEPLCGQYFCQKTKGHKGNHRITVIPNPEET